MARVVKEVRADYNPPEGVTEVLDLELHLRVFSNGVLGVGNRVVRYDDSLPEGLVSMMSLAALSIGKDALLHQRWNVLESRQDQIDRLSEKLIPSAREERKNRIKEAAAKIKGKKK